MKRDEISFLTDGSWSVREFARALEAIDVIHQVLLAAFVARRDFPAELVTHLNKEVLHPRDSLLTEVDQISRGNQYIGYVYDNLDTLAPDESLKIKSVEIHSPGVVSFMGLAEVVKEFREFVKDMWYRNQHERQLARIELARKRLECGPVRIVAVRKIQQNMIASVGTDELAVLILRNADSLKELVDDGNTESWTIEDRSQDQEEGA